MGATANSDPIVWNAGSYMSIANGQSIDSAAINGERP
jgi:hypothetical protein